MPGPRREGSDNAAGSPANSDNTVGSNIPDASDGWPSALICISNNLVACQHILPPSAIHQIASKGDSKPMILVMRLKSLRTISSRRPIEFSSITSGSERSAIRRKGDVLTCSSMLHSWLLVGWQIAILPLDSNQRHNRFMNLLWRYQRSTRDHHLIRWTALVT